MSTERQQNTRPKTGGKVDDRKNKSLKDTHTSTKGGKSDRFGKNQKGSQPKYDDTQEAKKQKEKIDKIDEEIIKAQQEIERVGKVKVVVRKPRQRLTNKEQILKEIENNKNRLNKADEEIKNLQPDVKRALEVVNDKRVAANRLKSGVFFFNVSDVNFIQTNETRLREEVKRLESKLETESLSIGEEKVVVQEIKKVKAMKVNFEPYQKRARDLKDAETTFNRLDRDLKKKVESLEGYKKTIQELQSDLNSLEEREKEAEQIRKEEEKKQKETEIKEKDEKTKLEDKLNELIKQYHHEKDVLVQMRDKWYEQRRQDRNKKLEEANQDRAERRKEQEKEEKEKVLQERHERKNAIPFHSEITVCQNLIFYLNELLNSTKVNEPTKDTKSETEQIEQKEQKKEDKDQGYIKGRNEHEDLLFPENLGQQKKKKKPTKKKKVAQKITHNWDTFTRFEEIGLGEPPITASQIPKAIEDVKVKLVEFQKKSQEERQVILKKLDEEEKDEKKREEERKKREKEEKEQTKEELKTTEEPKKEEGTETKESK